MNDLISVIIPVYNVEKYLEKCIDSVINQKYTNIEIILIDDGSTDNSGIICDKYAKKDNRIKVIHKKNGGLSDARNCGLDKCLGKYVTFIDSDDYVSNNYINDLYNCLDDSDISTCDYICFDNDLKIPNYNLKINKLNNEQALEDMLYQKGTTTCAWGKLYKTSLFENIRYPKGKICEDLDTTYKLFSKAKYITITNIPNYYYFQRVNSIINSKFSLNRMDALEFSLNMKKYISKKHPNILLSAINREFMEAIFIFQKLNFKQLNTKECNKIFKVIKNNRKVVLFDKKSRKIYRLYALISYFSKYILLPFLKVKIRVFS